MKTFTIFGPPGTGKTTEMVRRINYANKHGVPMDRIVFVSFTRAAAAEAMSRLAGEDSPRVSTIHSYVFRQLGLSRAQVVNRDKLQSFADSIGVPISQGASAEDNESAEEGDHYLSLIALMKNKFLLWNVAYDQSSRPGTRDDFRRFMVAYGRWKDANGLLDFTDMLERYYTMSDPEPMDADIVFLDEAQDCTPLQWAAFEKMVEGVTQVMLAGDDDQCQPTGTLVRTNRGRVPIERLRTGDRVTAYSRSHSTYCERKIEIASRPYDGQLIEVSTNNATTKYTPEHICLVRPVDDPNLRVVYIMRKGDQFRIGETKAVRYNGTGRTMYPVTRARQEGADDLWLVSTHGTPSESLAQEQLLSVKYGIPQTVFTYKNLGLDSRSIVWETLNNSGIDFEARVAQLLEDHGLSLALPHIKSNGGTKVFQCYACNLLPDLHQLPESDGSSPLAWSRFEKRTTNYSGFVYSMTVDKNRTYIGDGIMTHNCIFSWAGADPTEMAKFGGDQDRTVLGQSYRIPKSVHRVAESIASRIDPAYRVAKKYEPRDEEGEVNFFGSPEAVPLDYDGSTLVLYRSHSFRKALEDRLREEGIAYVADSGFPSPLQNKYGRAIMMYMRLQSGARLKPKEIDALLNLATPKGAKVIEGAQEHPDNNQVADLPFDKAINLPPFLTPYYLKVDWGQAMGHGERQPVHLSTIHGAKGREADRVILLSDMPQRAIESMEADPDPEHRVFYVAVTRARHRLDVVEGDMSYPIPRVK